MIGLDSTHERKRARRTLFRGGVFSALGRRDYRLLWTGAFVSNIGTWIHTAVLLWFVKDITRSNAWVGAVNMANYLPVLFFVLPAGSLADYLDRKRLIVWGQVVMMLCALALGLLTTLGHATLPAIMVITTIMGIAFAINFPAWQSVLPDLVSDQDLLNAIALSAAQFNLARFIGPMIGGLFIIWSVAAAFYFNALSFIFVIGALLFVRTPTPGYPPPEEGTIAHIKEGVRFVGERRWMVWLLVSIAVTSFFGFSCIVLMPSVTRDVLMKSSWVYSLLLGTLGLGAFISAPLVTYLGQYFKEANIVKFCALTLGLSVIALSLSRTLWLSCLITFGIGASFLMMSVSINTSLQKVSDRAMRGRVMSLYIMMMVGVFPVGGQVLGIVSDRSSTPAALLVGGCACVALSLVLILFPGLTRDAG
jgi:MFS family permease